MIRWKQAVDGFPTEGGVQLVIVPVDYSENIRVLVDELKNRVMEVAQ
jgi:acetolactate synthase-1/2/3 large subunit